MTTALDVRTHAPVVDPWLTLKEAAAEAKLNPETLRSAIARGQLRAIKVNGGHGPYRLRRSWVDTWLEGDEAAYEPPELRRVRRIR
jgi:excisionase family DNA binding protein